MENREKRGGTVRKESQVECNLDRRREAFREGVPNRELCKEDECDEREARGGSPRITRITMGEMEHCAAAEQAVWPGCSMHLIVCI